MAGHTDLARPAAPLASQAGSAAAFSRATPEVAAIGEMLNASPRVVAQRALAQHLNAAASRRRTTALSFAPRAPVAQLRRIKISNNETIDTAGLTKSQLEELLEWEDEGSETWNALTAAIAAQDYVGGKGVASSSSSTPPLPPPIADGSASSGTGRSAFLADITRPDRAPLKPPPAAAPVPDFASDTVGAEQELTGGKYRIRIAEKSRGTVGTVAQGGETLVYYTTDIGGNGEYTIELKTTPCSHEDQTALDARREAMGVMYSAIETAGERNGPVTNQTVGDFVIHILQKDHRIVRDSASGSSFGNQVSIGMKTSDLIDPAANNKHFPLVTGAWYDPHLKDDLPPDGLSAPDMARQAYALVSSVIAFINDLSRDAAKSDGASSSSSSSDAPPPEIAALSHPAVKNAWGSLPRTPAWDWLDPLAPPDRTVVTAAIDVKYAGSVGLKYVRQRQSLGSHPIPPFKIQGQPGSVFEVRSPDRDLDKYLYDRE